MKTYTVFVRQCQFIYSMISLRRFYDFDYSIRPSLDVSLTEANIRRYELKPVPISQFVGDWKKTHYLS